jgi:hypothetical protein
VNAGKLHQSGDFAFQLFDDNQIDAARIVPCFTKHRVVDLIFAILVNPIAEPYYPVALLLWRSKKIEQRFR